MKQHEPKLGDFSVDLSVAESALNRYSSMREVPGAGSNNHRTRQDAEDTRTMLSQLDSIENERVLEEIRTLAENGENLLDVLMENRSLKAELALEKFNSNKLLAIIKVLEDKIKELSHR